jgi:hypothetical protein
MNVCVCMHTHAHVLVDMLDSYLQNLLKFYEI